MATQAQQAAREARPVGRRRFPVRTDAVPTTETLTGFEAPSGHLFYVFAADALASAARARRDSSDRS